MKTLRFVVCNTILLTYSLCSAGQAGKLAELLHSLNSPQSDSVTVAIYIDISDIYSRQQNDSALFYLNRAQALVEQDGGSEGWAQMALGDITRNRGNFYYFKSSFAEAIDYYIRAAELYDAVGIHRNPTFIKRSWLC